MMVVFVEVGEFFEHARVKGEHCRIESSKLSSYSDDWFHRGLSKAAGGLEQHP